MRNVSAGLAVACFGIVAFLLPGDDGGGTRLLALGLAFVALTLVDWSRLPRPPHPPR